MSDTNETDEAFVRRLNDFYFGDNAITIGVPRIGLSALDRLLKLARRGAAVKWGPRQAMSDRVIKMADERGEFQYLEDGFLYYWPSGGGAISAEQLRTLADELDRRNAKWAADIEAHFSKQETCDD